MRRGCELDSVHKGRFHSFRALGDQGAVCILRLMDKILHYPL